MRFFIFFMLFVVQLKAQQEVLFEGYVYDNKTKEPIPYVNLSFLNTLKGTSTDDNGYFFLDIPTAYLAKQVHISSLGYKDTIVNAKSVFLAKQFYLVEESFELDEVVLVQDYGDSEVLNPITSYSLTSGFSSSSTPWVLALYFPNLGAVKKYVNKITIFFQQNNKFTRETSKFRLRIYDVDPITKKPKNNLLRKSVVLETYKSKEYVSIDMSAFNIKVPKEGIYIGLEWLFVPHNWYKKLEKHPITNKVIVEDRFAPTFRGIYNKNQNYKVMVYGMGAWNPFLVKSKDHTQNFIPAISLKLSKNK